MVSGQFLPTFVAVDELLMLAGLHLLFRYSRIESSRGQISDCAYGLVLRRPVSLRGLHGTRNSEQVACCFSSCVTVSFDILRSKDLRLE
jgi:hypothetical protein